MEELIRFFLESSNFEEKFNNALKAKIQERINILCDDLSEEEKNKIREIMFEKLNLVD